MSVMTAQISRGPGLFLRSSTSTFRRGVPSSPTALHLIRRRWWGPAYSRNVHVYFDSTSPAYCKRILAASRSSSRSELSTLSPLLRLLPTLLSRRPPTPEVGGGSGPDSHGFLTDTVAHIINLADLTFFDTTQ